MDIFPRPQDALPEGPLLQSTIKEDYLNLQRVTGFTFRLYDGESIQFYKIYEGHPNTWTHEILRDNFVRTALASSRVDRDFRPDKVDFERLQKRYEKPLKKSGHNTDVRAAFCWDDNVFLTKAYFTFGQRTVPPGFVHVYKTTQAPVLFYKLDPSKPQVRKFRVAERHFHKNDQWVYDPYVLRPHTTYAVPEGTTYTLLTVQKTLFALHVVPADACDSSLMMAPDTERRWNRPDDGGVKDEKRIKRKRVHEDDDESSSCSSKASVCPSDLVTVTLDESGVWDNTLFTNSPDYPRGTELETMLIIEGLKLQVDQLKQRLSQYETVK